MDGIVPQPVLQGAGAASRVPQGAGLARFMELRGHRVLEALGVLWHSVGYGLYISFPYHLRLDVNPNEAGDKLASLGAHGVRYPSLKWSGLPSGLYVCRRKDYDIPVLHRNFRRLVKQGLTSCEIRPLTEKELIVDGLRINREGLKRQGRYDPEFGNRKQWSRFARAVQESPAIAAIGALVDGRVTSYAITYSEGAWVHILYKMTSLEFDDDHPSQVLDFTITRSALADPSVEAVSMGWAPLVPLSGIHDYKIRLGYDYEPQNSVIRLSPALQRTAGSRLAWAALKAAQFVHHSQTFDMALAVLEGARLTREHSPQTASATA